MYNNKMKLPITDLFLNILYVNIESMMYDITRRYGIKENVYKYTWAKFNNVIIHV